jgi:hypothetical protein
MEENLVTQLPQQLADLQKEFEAFFKNTEKHKRLKYVYEQMIAVTGISAPNLKLLISKAMSPQLLLFTASKKEIGEQTVLGWNSKFETKGKKKICP